MSVEIVLPTSSPAPRNYSEASSNDLLRKLYELSIPGGASDALAMLFWGSGASLGTGGKP
eukprot:9473197-Pyramimonas_sp.AAC.1